MNIRPQVATLLTLSLFGCASDATGTRLSTDAPVVTNANGTVVLTVGSPVSYDATKSGTVFSDPAGAGLTYSISFGTTEPGLGASGGTIFGNPAKPCVVTATLTAVDRVGRSATDQFTIVVFSASLQAPVLPLTLAQYADAEVPLPGHFSALVDGVSVAATDNLPGTNPITDAGATLGRVLFYDTRLSGNDGASCASCHVQSLGFSDAGQRSVGFAGGLTGRHSTALANARFYTRGRFFWDERAATLEAQVLGPIQDATEMGMTLPKLTTKLAVTSYYPPLFNAAFGTTAVTSERVALALAQYVRALVSAGSRYDRAFSAAGVPNFALTMTAQEQQGEQLFRSSGCASCHTTVAQVSDSVHNIGLDATNADTGAGRGAFKVASLRNVAVRPRYMHDGRFTTLEQVVDFFDAGVQANPALDPRLKAADGTPRRLGLTGVEKASLVAFLKTLTDSAFLTAARFSNPFSAAVAVPVTTALVTMQNKAFLPATLTVAPGATVSWTNLDNSNHSALFDSAAIPTTGIFSSGSRTLQMPTAPGTYPYHCAVHGLQMSGTVIVQ